MPRLVSDSPHGWTGCRTEAAVSGDEGTDEARRRDLDVYYPKAASTRFVCHKTSLRGWRLKRIPSSFVEGGVAPVNSAGLPFWPRGFRGMQRKFGRMRTSQAHVLLIFATSEKNPKDNLFRILG